MSAWQPPLYEVRRSARARRARLTVTDAGEALVVLPAGAPDTLAASLVARHAAWLERHQRRIRAERHALAARPPLDAGRSVLVAGVEQPVVVEVVAGSRSSVLPRAAPSPAILVRVAETGMAAAGPVLERWLRAEARRRIGAAVARRGREMGLRPASISIRDQRTRWGSASARGSLSFSWRLVMCPPAVLDYVVVHELAHLRWRGHGPRFWALVERYVPDAAVHRRWLRSQQRMLQAALD